MRGSTKHHRARGFSTMLIIIGVLVLVAAGLGFVLVQNNDGADRRTSSDLFAVKRDSFEITIPASGELLALQQIEVRNRLESRATIMEIVDEGRTVQAGDLLLRLNDEEIRNRIKDAEDALNNAESALIASRANLAIRRSAAASELDRAQLNKQLTELALRAWREGEVEATREQLELAKETAEINWRRLEDRLENSRKLYEQEFISHDELERDRIAAIEARSRLTQAEREITVYEEYTFLQQQMQKRSDVDQAIAELERVQQRHEAEIETARADVVSKEHQLESRRERLADLNTQLEHTVVTAPSDGLVVYASSMESQRRGSNDPPQVGTDLSRNELVMVLPDTSRMIASVKINEALSGVIRPGQRARVTSDAMPDQVLTGTVLNVGVLAESGGWRDPNRRDYTVRIQLNETGERLRPSMRCRAEIFVDRVSDVLHVPVQSVYRQGRQAHVFVPVRGGYEQRGVTLGRASELYVEVRDGLSEGDFVLMREPSSSEIIRSGGDVQLAERGQGDEAPTREAPSRDAPANRPSMDGSTSAEASETVETDQPAQRERQGERQGERPSRRPGPPAADAS